MIKCVVGDIFTSSARCIVNTVNCEGYMGKGIAYQFKCRYPENNKSYVEACRAKTLCIGAIHTFEEGGKIIVNFPTKDKWREKSNIEYIKVGMQKLVAFVLDKGIESIAIPPLGCGNGGLIWQDVKQIIIDFFQPIQELVRVEIYEPSRISNDFIVKKTTKPTLSHLVLMEIKMGLNIWNKFRMQKTAYFTNIFAGENFFKFKRYTYGPYSHSIDIIARNIRESQAYYNFHTEQYKDYCMKQLISKNIENRFVKYSQAITKAVSFVNGFKSDKQLELVSSVCYILEDGANNDMGVYEALCNWSDRKGDLFSLEDVRWTLDIMSQEGIVQKDLLGNYYLKNAIK